MWTLSSDTNGKLTMSPYEVEFSKMTSVPAVSGFDMNLH